MGTYDNFVEAPENAKVYIKNPEMWYMFWYYKLNFLKGQVMHLKPIISLTYVT